MTVCKTVFLVAILAIGVAYVQPLQLQDPMETVFRDDADHFRTDLDHAAVSWPTWSRMMWLHPFRWNPSLWSPLMDEIDALRPWDHLEATDSVFNDPFFKRMALPLARRYQAECKLHNQGKPAEQIADKTASDDSLVKEESEPHSGLRDNIYSENSPCACQQKSQRDQTSMGNNHNTIDNQDHTSNPKNLRHKRSKNQRNGLDVGERHRREMQDLERERMQQWKRQMEWERQEELAREEARLQEQKRQELRQREILERRSRLLRMQKEEEKRRARYHNEQNIMSGIGNKHVQPKTKIASLKVSGYLQKDISIKSDGQNLHIKGRHACDCEEACVLREFERVYQLPPNTKTRSLKATLNKDGELTVEGSFTNSAIEQVDTKVPIEGVGLDQLERQPVKCPHKKTGIKLSKIDKRTGKAYVPETYESAHRASNMEHEIEDDGVTIEVE